MVAWRACALATALLTVGACSARECSAVGAVSQVDVRLPDRKWQLVGLCLDGHGCADANAPVAVLVAAKPADYTYRLTVRRADGTTLDRSGAVRTVAYRVNGAGCDPLTATATLVVGPQGDVTIDHPG